MLSQHAHFLTAFDKYCQIFPKVFEPTDVSSNGVWGDCLQQIKKLLFLKYLLTPVIVLCPDCKGPREKRALVVSVPAGGAPHGLPLHPRRGLPRRRVLGISAQTGLLSILSFWCHFLWIICSPFEVPFSLKYPFFL